MAVVEEAYFRPICTEDLEALAREDARAYEFPWTLSGFADVVRYGWWGEVLTDGETLLAWGVMLPVLDEADILTIAVNVDYQGRGLGRRMLNHMMQSAQKKGIRLLHLEVRVSNTRAIALYESSQFERVGMRRGYYPAQSGREDALLMNKKLISEGS